MLLRFIVTIGFLLLFCPRGGFASDPHKPAPEPITGNAWVDKLLSEMTLSEKISLIHGALEPASTYQGQAGYWAGLPRLGIPPLRMADGPPGILTRIPSSAPTCTMGLAATFSLSDAQKNGELLARQARARGVSVVLQPFINIDRDLAFERAYNTFGEDPLLTGNIGAAMIRGVQSQGILAQAKHYVAYDGENRDIAVGRQALHEIYAAPFVAASDAGVSSIMCSYNRINGEYACGNKDALENMLRREIGFKGFVTADWGAVHAPGYLSAGTDLEMPGNLYGIPGYYGETKPSTVPFPNDDKLTEFKGFWDGRIPEEPAAPRRAKKTDPGFPFPDKDIRDALNDGTVNEAAITRAVSRILLQLDRFGYLDGKQIGSLGADSTNEDAATIRKTAEDAAVLLKNDAHTLPLTHNALNSVVLIGPGAGQTIAMGKSMEKALGLPERQIGTADALRRFFPELKASIGYEVADDMTGAPIPSAYFSHDGQPGLKRIEAAGASPVTDLQIDFTKMNGKSLPANAKASWTGTLQIPAKGKYRLQLQTLGCVGALWLDGKEVISNGKMWMHGDVTQAGQDDLLPTTDGLDNLRIALELPAGPHKLSVAVAPDGSGNPAQVRLNWVTPEQMKANYVAAIDAARHAKTAVVFAWSRLYPIFGLPGDQDQLIADVAAVNPNTIVVLNVSQPVAMPWIDRVKAVLQMWWPGDEGGWATANVLLGRKNPAGRLPFTWGRRLQDYPASDPKYPERSGTGVDGKTTFSEGIYVGYRWFDKQKIEPLFPFGYGLSYTQFAYSGIAVNRARDGGLDVSFTITNTGSMPGEETPQVYLGAPQIRPAGIQFADHALAAFERIQLDAGASRTVTLHVPLRSLQYWPESGSHWMLAQGARQVSVGSSSRDLKLTGSIAIHE
ncbi:MAG: glycoside hydrolase family 3 C-terminal domain-containing protein [Terracidiphilus sp.]|nr:glycoside hydrolase family 3 C-terminal domain-containing protein [Terracidiphilus sp.]